MFEEQVRSLFQKQKQREVLDRDISRTKKRIELELKKIGGAFEAKKLAHKNNGNGVGTGNGLRHCSNCGKTGHSKVTCSEKKKVRTKKVKAKSS